MIRPNPKSDQGESNVGNEAEQTQGPTQGPRRIQSTSDQPSAPFNGDTRQRPSNSVRQQGQPSGSNSPRTASTTPSTANTHTSYDSFPSQQSVRAPSSTALSQTPIPPRNPSRVPPNPVTTAPPEVQGYQNITSIEPAPKRPLWSLGTTLPRVRRLPVKATKTAYPTPGSRSNIVQQPPDMLPMMPTRQRTARTANAGTAVCSPALTDSPGGPEELVHSRDFADTTRDESYNAGVVAPDSSSSDEVGGGPIASNSASAGAADLPPIHEGEPLPNKRLPEPVSGPPSSNRRPRLGYSYSSPTVAKAADAQLLGDDKIWTGPSANQGSKLTKQADRTIAQQPRVSFGQQQADVSDPQQRLSAARKQLMEEARHGDGLLATQGSAVDATDFEDSDGDTDERTEGTIAVAQLGGVTSHPASKHIKTASMPFLPSQGFDVLIPASIHKGANQLTSEVHERNRSRAESQSQNRSAMEQTRHPGLSGARPPPKGRAAGGPAAGVGTRKASNQSQHRASIATNEERSGPSYFDLDALHHEVPQLDRQGSARYRRGSQQSHQTDEVHIEARPVGGRNESHRSSHGQDARSAWLGNTMPSHAGRRQRDGDENRKSASLRESRGQDARTSLESGGEPYRHSEETAFSSTSAEQSYESGQGGEQLGEGTGLGSDEAQKVLEGEEDENWLGGQETLPDGRIAFPTTWARWRYHGREFIAELLATLLLIMVGTAVDCQVTLSQALGSSAGAYPNQNWAWGFAVASTIYLSGGRSGAHCNPAITLSLAVFRGFPWIQVPVYWSAQVLGSMLGAAITYGIYLPAIDKYEGGRDIRTLAGDHGTGRLFVTVPQLVFTTASGFGTEVAATGILMAMVLAVGDETNAPPSDGLAALVLGFVVVMIGMSFGWPTSYAISPSRDLGPRIFLYMVGYGKVVWTDNHFWWLYGPIAGCFTGGLLGAFLYDLAIFTGEESPINYTKQGWKQSTPARLGSRFLNSTERAQFFARPLRLRRRAQNAGDDEGVQGSDVSAVLDGGRALADTRSENSALGNKHGIDSAGPLERMRSHTGSNLRRQAGAIDGQERRPSHASQQLDAQELGRGQPALEDNR